MRCYCCDNTTEFHSRKDINPKKELLICKNCGNVMYSVNPEDEAKVKDYYRKEYRPAPNIMNLITSTHKNHYVRMFLQDYLKDKKGLVCADIGSAIGYIPNLLRRMGHKATGCELTLTYRRFCQHFYGIPLTEEINEKYQYDLITIYHVLEHLVEPDAKLKKYVSLLKDDGVIMVATPAWFDVLEEASGTPLSSMENLFHHDHINVFSKQSIKNLFARCGLEIVKENYIQYGQTYLLKKAKEEKPIVKENWEEINTILDTQKQAMKLHFEKKYLEAVELYPKFPDAWLALIFEQNMKIPEKQAEYFAKAFEVMPNVSRLHLTYGVHLYQQAKYDEAIKHFMWMIENRPGEDVMMYLGWCFTHMGNHHEAMKWFHSAADMNPMKWSEAMNYICAACSKLPTWDEMAMDQIKEQLVKQAAPKLEPNDPLMESSINQK